MNVRVHNRTGLTIHTSAHASSPALALADVPVEMPAEAWEHTLACAPGLRPLVGAEGGIEVTVVGAQPAPIEVAPVEAVEPVAEVVEAPAPPVPVLVPKGKRR